MKNLPVTDAELWAFVKKRVDAKPPVSLTVIADDLEISVDELVAWIMSYNEPKRQRAEIRKAGSLPAPLSELRSTDAQRFANWRKAQGGAFEARRAVK